MHLHTYLNLGTRLLVIYNKILPCTENRACTRVHPLHLAYCLVHFQAIRQGLTFGPTIYAQPFPMIIITLSTL